MHEEDFLQKFVCSSESPNFKYANLKEKKYIGLCKNRWKEKWFWTKLTCSFILSFFLNFNQLPAAEKWFKKRASLWTFGPSYFVRALVSFHLCHFFRDGQIIKWTFSQTSTYVLKEIMIFVNRLNDGSLRSAMEIFLQMLLFWEK